MYWICLIPKHPHLATQNTGEYWLFPLLIKGGLGSLPLPTLRLENILFNVASSGKHKGFKYEVHFLLKVHHIHVVRWGLSSGYIAFIMNTYYRATKLTSLAHACFLNSHSLIQLPGIISLLRRLGLTGMFKTKPLLFPQFSTSRMIEFPFFSTCWG